MEPIQPYTRMESDCPENGAHTRLDSTMSAQESSHDVPHGGAGRLPLTAFLQSHWPAIGLLLAYLAILIYFRGNFELTGDDGRWALLARGVVERKLLTLYGVMGSEGGPNSSLGIYLGALSYWIHPTMASIRAGVLVFVILTHALLIRLGRDLEDVSTGLCASLMFFFAPAFFVFYNQKLWQVAYLPFFSTAALFLAVRYVKTRRWRTLAAAYVAAGLCCGLHQASALLLPAVMIAPALIPERDRPGYAQALMNIVLLVLSCAHLLAWCWRARPPEAPAMAAFLLVPLLCVRGTAWKADWFHPLIVAGLPIAVLCCSVLDAGFTPLAAVGRLVDLLPGFNAYIAAHVGWSGPVLYPWLQTGGPWLSLPVAVFAAYLVHALLRWRELPLEQKLLFYWNWIPVWLLALSGLVFHEYPHQWFVFLFPAPFLAITVTLRRLMRSSALPLRWGGAAILAAILAAYLLASFTFARFVSRSGGISWHMANLDVKMKVMEWVYSQDSRPKVILVGDPAGQWLGYECTGWTAADWEVRAHRLEKTGALEKRVFYIHEPSGSAQDQKLWPRRKDLDAGHLVLFGPVRVLGLNHEVSVPGQDIGVLSDSPCILPFVPAPPGSAG